MIDGESIKKYTDIRGDTSLSRRNRVDEAHRYGFGVTVVWRSAITDQHFGGSVARIQVGFSLQRL